MTHLQPMLMAFVLLSATLFTTQPAYAISYWACLKTEAAFEDNDNIQSATIDVHDDYDDDNPNPMNGVSARIRYSPRPCNIESSWDGSDIQTLWWGDLNYDGCTNQMIVSATGGCFEARVWSSGSPRFTSGTPPGNQLRVYDKDGFQLSVLEMSQPFVSNSFAHTLDYTFAGTLFRVYATLAYAMGTFSGGLRDETINAYVFPNGDPDNVCPCGANSGSHACDSRNLCIVQDTAIDDTKNMFLMAHEYGHANLILGNGHHPDNDCSYATAGAGTGQFHSMESLEFQSCAMMEGWSNFVAVDTFTIHPNGNGPAGSNPNARIGYWGTACGGTLFTSEGFDVISAESGTGSNCPVDTRGNIWFALGGGSFTGYATEVDWMRTFWDYHTNRLSADPGFTPTHTEMRREFAAAAFTTNDLNAFDELRRGVARGQVGATPTTATCTQLQRLDYMANVNGTDLCNPSGSCDSTGCP